MMVRVRNCGHLMRRVDSLEKTLLGGIGGRRRRGSGVSNFLDEAADLQRSGRQTVNLNSWGGECAGPVKGARVEHQQHLLQLVII